MNRLDDPFPYSPSAVMLLSGNYPDKICIKSKME